MKAKITFITVWMLCGINIAFAAPATDATDVTEQQQRAKQQEMEQQSRVDAPSVMTESEKTAQAIRQAA